MDLDAILDGGQQTVLQLRQHRENQSIIKGHKTDWTGHYSLELWIMLQENRQTDKW